MKLHFPEIIKQGEKNIFDAWVAEQLAATTMRRDLISEHELREQSSTFIKSFGEAIRGDFTTDISRPIWKASREILDGITRSRARLGFSPTETATFVFSLKSVLFHQMIKQLPPEVVVEELWTITELLDKLGLFTTESFQKGREEVIRRQQSDMLELSTPVVELAEGIIALPLIGTLDSNRAQTVMEVLLESIVSSRADIAIIDITGVPTVDTLVAQHLMKTVAAARLMGADCLISGIRPQIAQTIVQLGIDLGHVHTKASLADAFRMALKQKGLVIQKAAKAGVN
jgi:rsbT co-antagonist protein RsbR